ncbi:hypothetical protein Ple7327_3415 [Pleurocapsa sp. PCC 7327]|uniref:hypothetical protein n=1 Tax=Pleurocapsa sp. PCC 7327 TaxID=118163 RepID=UPI00029FC1A6|nr:hypothetical protein [Pleurocapsa sp. PCC 7327]AFY78623.1 hypothetical protein Ple7327_3415 [Pleurocapsa sp. PCC 7327]
MSENLTTPVSAAEIKEVILELEQYRERLVNEMLQMAQKAKFSKKAAMEHLSRHPEIARIDAAIEKLRAQQIQ